MLTQCKSEPTAPVKVAAGNLNVAMSSNVASAAVGKTFTFPGGGAALTSSLAGQTFALTFTSSSAATFAVGTGTASAAVAYGSCTFTVTGSTIAGLPNGVYTIPNCNMTFNTSGTPVGGTATVGATLTLGGVLSNPIEVSVTIDSNGTVAIGSSTLGTVTITNGTGG
ncbi:MAG TPA: hypothetical protein VG916_00565 [Gemmatimonadaceae bacterium]|nr:hypothetical protein [Gemmatimonadaceae bacterium]